ncbi:MAG: class I SAM-dependent methyltransferase [Anaerolineae bacterium]
MKFLELKDISERHIDLVNPTSPEKILAAGRVAGMAPGQRVIDFGCGYAAPLALWAQAYGIAGVGIDIRPAACERARQNLANKDLSRQIEIVCASGAAYVFEPNTFDVATCIGASFIWPNGFSGAVRAMKSAIKPNGRLIVGEVFWNDPRLVPPDILAREAAIYPETEIYAKAREAGCEVIYALHSNQDDWDHYVTENWRGLSDWLDENPHHPDYAQVLAHMRENQDNYAAYERQHLGWALYILKQSR